MEEKEDIIIDGKYVAICDLKNKRYSECTLNPTDVLKSESPWLFAFNTKYRKNYDLEEDSYVDSEKVGKWMLFLTKAEVNVIWSKIKAAIKCGVLWNSKVSTSEDSNPIHAIMIFTKDYTDLEDVTNVLDFLEISGIKPPNKIIKYKTDQQTLAGIYSSRKQKASIYDSKTIRQLRNKKIVTDFFKKTS